MKTNRSRWLISGLSALTLATPVHAQTTTGTAPASSQSEQTSGLDDIVVTARKVSENLQRVPIAITALGGDALRQASIKQLNDVQSKVPNLLLQEHPVEPQGFAISLRGQQQNDIPLTADPSVGIYVDGLYHPRTLGLRGALEDIDRIEVLRGPQGTLYGRNTTGGAISIFTAQPKGEFGASVHARYGNFNAFEVGGTINLPLAENVAVRFTGNRLKRDGFGKDAVGRDLADDDGWLIRGKLNARIGDTLEVNLFGDYQDSRIGGGIWRLAALAPPSLCPPGVPPLPGCLFTLQAIAQTFPNFFVSDPATQGQNIAAVLGQLQSYIDDDPYRTNTPDPSFSNFRSATGGLDLRQELSDDISVRSITGYQWFNRVNGFDTDGTPIKGINSILTTKDRYFSQEIQFLGQMDNLDWVGGLYYGRESGLETGPVLILPFILGGALPIVYEARVLNTNYAAFAQANWRFAEGWHLTGGIRYSIDNRQIRSNNTSGGVCVVPAAGTLVSAPPEPTDCGRKFRNRFSAPSWLVSIDHELGPNILGYAKVSRGFRTGGQNFRGSSQPESFAPFAPERVTEYETGLKTEFLDRRARVNIAVFYDDYKDIQRSVPVPTQSGGVATVIDNAASARIFGGEIDAQFRPTDRFTLSGAVGYTDAKYREYTDLLGKDRSKENFGVPKWTANVTARYVQPTSAGDLSLQMGYRWQSKLDLFPSSPVPLIEKGYGLMDARASLQIDSLDAEVAIFGRNLTNKTYRAAAQSLVEALGFAMSVTGQPRTYGLEITKRFGRP